MAISPLERELGYLREINERHFKPRGDDMFQLSALWVAFVNEHGREPNTEEWDTIREAARRT